MSQNFTNIDYSQFIRTTDKQHEEIVQKIFDKLLKQGDIYPETFGMELYGKTLGIVGTVENGILRIVVRDLKYNYIDTVDVVKKDR